MIVTTRESFFESLAKFTDIMTVDIESDGFDLWNVNRLCGIGVSTSNDEQFYYPFRHVPADFPLFEMLGIGDLNLPIELLQPLFRKLEESSTLVGHNIKFDLIGMYKDGYNKPDSQVLEDTVSFARLFFRGRWDRLSLDNCARTLYPESEFADWKDDLKQYIKDMKLTTFNQINPEKLGLYCKRDCKATWHVRNGLIQHIQMTDQTQVFEQERDLTSVLWDMEKEGLYFDREYCIQAIPKLQAKIKELADMIYAIMGYEFDILSNTQLTKAMNKLGYTSPFKGKNDKGEKWGSDVLLGLDNEVGGLILEYRGVEKMLGTYFLPLLKWVDDRQHPKFKSSGAVTGRMSCHDPNLQNLGHKSIQLEGGGEQNEEAVAALKARLGTHGQGGDIKGAAMGAGTFSNIISTTSSFTDDENSIAIRRLYIAPDGFKMYMIDYDQMEMRVFSDYVKDESMLATLEDPDFDFHGYVAREVWKIDPSNTLWKFYRTLAKAINFGLLYGIGDDKLAQQIQKSKEEAQKYKLDYFARFPKARIFMKQVVRTVEDRGWIKNRFGRKYWIERDKAYTGVNYLIQGTSADVVKNRMIACHKWLKENNCKSRLVVQIHDEVVFYIADEEETFVPLKMKEILEERVLDTLLPVEVSKGFPSWAEKGKVCFTCYGKDETNKEKGIVHRCPMKKKRRKVDVSEV